MLTPARQPATNLSTVTIDSDRGPRRVRRRSVERHVRRCSCVVTVLVVPFVVLALAGSCRAAGLIAANYALNWDETIDKTNEGTKTQWIFKQTLDTKYRGFLKPAVENEITLKVEHEINTETEPRQKIRVTPVITLGYKASYWSAGAKRTIDDSNEPGKNPKTTDSYFVEFFFRPARATLPDIKGKYTIDEDFESGTTDTNKRAVLLSSDYKPNNWLELKGEYSRNTTDDRLKPDSDTEEEKYTAAIGVRHMVSSKIKVNSEFQTQETRGATLLSAGGATNAKRDQVHTWKNTFGFRPFRDTAVDASYDWELKENFETAEHDYQKNAKATVSQKIAGVFDVKGDFSRVETEVRHTADDNEKTEDSWTFEFGTRLSKLFDVTLKYEGKDAQELHSADTTRNTTSGTRTWNGAWNGEMTQFWKASVSYQRTDTLERGATKTLETKYSLRSTLDFKPINLTLDPTYDITQRDDRLALPPLPRETETRDVRFKIAWKALSTRSIEVKMDHTYGRKEDTAAQNVQRSDSSNLNVVWQQPFPNWNFGTDVTRSATDTSEDDLPPDVTTTYSFKADYKYEMLVIFGSYKYDRKSLADEVATVDFKCGWTAPRWDISFTYSFSKTYSVDLKESYKLGLAFKYNL